MRLWVRGDGLVRPAPRSWPATRCVHLARMSALSHAKVLLLHNGRVIAQVFDGNVSGTFHVNFPKPTQVGLYAVKVIAKADGITKTAVKTFRVTLSAPAKKPAAFTG